LFNFEIAEQLNRDRVKTLSGKGKWTANRVKHARNSLRYDAAVETLEDEALRLVPLSRRDYVTLKQVSLWMFPESAAREQVYLPLGGRPLDPMSCSEIRRGLLEGKAPVLEGPDGLFDIMRSGPLKWQHYISFVDALRKSGVAREGEFVRLNGIDLPARLPPYALQLSDAKARGRPILPVKLWRSRPSAD
jgi:hypothetical protein